MTNPTMQTPPTPAAIVQCFFLGGETRGKVFDGNAMQIDWDDRFLGEFLTGGRDLDQQKVHDFGF